MGESGRRKGKEPVDDSYFVPMRSEATNEATASCSYPVPDEQAKQRKETDSRQLIPRRWRRREEPLKPPPGFHFRPTDQELAFKYLYNKKMYNSVPYDCIREANVYAAHPRELTEEFMKWGADGKWYFFTPRDRKYPLGDRPARHTADLAGRWRATGIDKRMYDDSIPHVHVVMKTLIFSEERDSDGVMTNWTMHEYIVVDESDVKGKKEKKLRLGKAKKQREPPTDMKLDDCVLCTIQRKRGAPEEDEASQAPSPSTQPRGGKRKMKINPDGASTSQQQQIVLPENNANEHQIVLSGNAEHDVIDANASNLQIVLTGEERIGSRPEDQFAGHIDSASTTPEEDIANQYMCFNPEEQIFPSWDPMESLSSFASDDWCEHVLSMSTPPYSPSQGNNSQDDPQGELTRP